MASLKPFVFFDLGDTIVDLADTIEVLARLISERYPIMAPDSHDLAKRWFVGLAQTVPRVESEPFEMQRDIGSRVLARSLATCGVTTDTPSARRLLRRAWDEWQENAKLCPGVTKEWLQQIGGLCAGVGAVTDGDDRDVKRLLEKTGLRPYFDSVTTSESVQAYKPSPRVYRAALDALRAPAARSLFVSHSSLDLSGAAAVGMSCACLGGSLHIDIGSLPTGTLQLAQPRDINRVLTRFAQTGRFELR